jgi:hypothetical protein
MLRRVLLSLVVATALVYLFFVQAWSSTPRAPWLLAPGILGSLLVRALGLPNDGVLNIVAFFVANILVWAAAALALSYPVTHFLRKRTKRRANIGSFGK